MLCAVDVSTRGQGWNGEGIKSRRHIKHKKRRKYEKKDDLKMENISVRIKAKRDDRDRDRMKEMEVRKAEREKKGINEERRKM
jgi:hypothetical protein